MSAAMYFWTASLRYARAHLSLSSVRLFE
jgi:hypothetical protein